MKHVSVRLLGAVLMATLFSLAQATDEATAGSGATAAPGAAKSEASSPDSQCAILAASATRGGPQACNTQIQLSTNCTEDVDRLSNLLQKDVAAMGGNGQLAAGQVLTANGSMSGSADAVRATQALSNSSKASAASAAAATSCQQHATQLSHMLESISQYAEICQPADVDRALKTRDQYNLQAQYCATSAGEARSVAGAADNAKKSTSGMGSWIMPAALGAAAGALGGYFLGKSSGGKDDKDDKTDPTTAQCKSTEIYKEGKCIAQPTCKTGETLKEGVCVADTTANPVLRCPEGFIADVPNNRCLANAGPAAPPSGTLPLTTTTSTDPSLTTTTTSTTATGTTLPSAPTTTGGNLGSGNSSTMASPITSGSGTGLAGSPSGGGSGGGAGGSSPGSGGSTNRGLASGPNSAAAGGGEASGTPGSGGYGQTGGPTSGGAGEVAPTHQSYIGNLNGTGARPRGLSGPTRRLAGTTISTEATCDLVANPNPNSPIRTVCRVQTDNRNSIREEVRNTR